MLRAPSVLKGPSLGPSIKSFQARPIRHARASHGLACEAAQRHHRTGATVGASLMNALSPAADQRSVSKAPELRALRPWSRLRVLASVEKEGVPRQEASAVMSIRERVAKLLRSKHRALFTATRHLFVFDQRDVAWLRARVHDPFHPDANSSWGMFNTGQKLLAWALSTSVVVVIVTGVLSWAQGREGGLPGAAVPLIGTLLAAHVCIAVVIPGTRPALHGMVFGSVRPSWAAKHHRAWLDTFEQQRSDGKANCPAARIRNGNRLGGNREPHE